MTPFMMPMAWLGGRSLTEMRDKTGAECDSSIAVGAFALVSAGIIGGGQYLFWTHLPHTAADASCITLAVTLLYVTFYRNLVRTQEVCGPFGKSVAYLIAAGIVSTNALLAGHEWVLLPFKPQVEAQANFDAAKGVTDYGSAVENSLGLPLLRTDSKSVDEALRAAQAERAHMPDAVIALRNQAERCERAAMSMHASIPQNPEAPGHAAATRAWREQHARCQTTRAQMADLLRKHVKQADERIADLSDKRMIIDKKLDAAKAEHEATLKRDTPSLNAAATTGFARHKALWAAVESGRVPLWAAAGLMFIALAFEGMSFLAKIFLPADRATQERVMESETDRALLKLRQGAINVYRAKVLAVVAETEDLLTADIKQNLENIVIPGLRTEVAARAFEQAHAAVAKAQHGTGKPAADLLSRLVDLGATVREAMAPGGGEAWRQTSRAAAS